MCTNIIDYIWFAYGLLCTWWPDGCLCSLFIISYSYCNQPLSFVRFKVQEKKDSCNIDLCCKRSTNMVVGVGLSWFWNYRIYRVTWIAFDNVFMFNMAMFWPTVGNVVSADFCFRFSSIRWTLPMSLSNSMHSGFNERQEFCNRNNGDIMLR